MFHGTRELGDEEKEIKENESAISLSCSKHWQKLRAEDVDIKMEKEGQDKLEKRIKSMITGWSGGCQCAHTNFTLAHTARRDCASSCV